MAIFVLVALSSYARPSELLRCTVYSLVSPVFNTVDDWSLLLSPEQQGQPSKTGEYDTSLVLDSPHLKPWSRAVFPINAKEAARQHFVVGFQLRRVRKGVQVRDRGPAGPTVTVSNAALRSKHRSGQKPANTARGPASRHMEKHKVCPEVRVVGTAGGSVSGVAKQASNPLPATRRTTSSASGRRPARNTAQARDQVFP